MCKFLWDFLIRRNDLLFYLLYYFRRITGDYYIIGDVVGDDRTGSYDDAVADGHARADDHSAAEPAVIANTDRFACLYGLPALQIVMRMIRRQQLAVRPDERVGTDGDTSAVQEHAVEIDHRPFADGDTVAVVAMERRTDDHRRMRIRDEGFDATV